MLIARTSEESSFYPGILQKDFSSKHRNWRNSKSAHSGQPFIFTCALLGDSNTGKTSLATRFCHHYFPSRYSPTNLCQLHTGKRSLGLGETIAHFHLWEINHSQIQNKEGEVEISSVAEMALKKCTAICYVYDLSNPISLEKGIETCFTLADSPDFNIQSITLIGNKQDLMDRENPEVLLQIQENEKRCVQRLRTNLLSLGKKITVDSILLSSKTTEKQEVDKVFTEAIGPSFIASFRQSPSKHHFSIPLAKETKRNHSFSQSHQSTFFTWRDNTQFFTSPISTLDATSETSEKKFHAFSPKQDFWFQAETLAKGVNDFLQAILAIFLVGPIYVGEIFISFFKISDQQTEKEKAKVHPSTSTFAYR